MKPNISRRQFLATTMAAAAAATTANAAECGANATKCGAKSKKTTCSKKNWCFDPLKRPGRMKIALYSMSYNGVWYKGGPAMDSFEVMRYAKKQGWEGIEYETKRPQLSPMDMTKDDRKRLRDLSAELELPICAVSPNSDLSSHIPEHREAELCYARECIKMTADLGSPICKVFTKWDGVIVRDGLGSYHWTRSLPDPYPQWQSELWDNVRDSLIELSKVAEDYGILLALQNHKPIVRNYKDVLRLIDEVDSPVFKACLDVPNERQNTSDKWNTQMAEDGISVLVHTHYGREFVRQADGKIKLRDNSTQFSYPAYVDALVRLGYNGFMSYEFCSPAVKNGQRAPISFVDHHTKLGLEYMKQLRADAEAKYGKNA